MVVTYYLNFFSRGADKHKGLLMSLLLVAEAVKKTPEKDVFTFCE